MTAVVTHYVDDISVSDIVRTVVQRNSLCLYVYALPSRLRRSV